jgi:glutamate-1-semialdehyde 2,1-aminomutase
MTEQTFTQNDALYQHAQNFLVAGVGAAGRFNGSLGHPVYFKSGDGAYLWDVDGRRYLDFNLSHGAALLGHNHPAIRQAVGKALDMGVICSCETEYTVKLAERICQVIPCAERVRFLPSGTEVTQVALRLARGYTGRPRILRFEGHFHGMHETVHFAPRQALSETGGVGKGAASMAGVPEAFGDYVTLAPWNDPDAFDRAMEEQGDEIAAVIMEPVCYNSGCIPADPDFLSHVRQVTAQKGIVLIFDEILSGFRTGIGCMQQYFGITPDLCTLAKAVSNGIPIAILAGKAEIMGQLAPLGPVAQSGTYSGHQFGVMAALATLQELSRPDFYPHIGALSTRLYDGMNESFARHGLPGRVQGLGSRFGIYFGIQQPVRNYQDAARRDSEMMHRFVRACFRRGLYFQSIGHAIGHSGICSAFTRDDIEWALEQIDAVLAELATR